MIVYPTTPEWSTPIVRALEFETDIVRGDDGTEQRTMGSPGRESWTLPYSMLTVAERDVVLAAVDAAQGSADQTVSLTFDGTAYDDLYIDADQLEFTETEPTRWSGQVKLCQVTRAASSGVLAADFPALNTGAVVQLPFRHGHQWDTVAVRTSGGRSAYANRAAAVLAWSVGGAVLTDAEAAAIWEMFGNAQGMWKKFGFTDPESATHYASCRFGVDKLEWRILGAGVNSIQATVVTIL